MGKLGEEFAHLFVRDEKRPTCVSGSGRDECVCLAARLVFQALVRLEHLGVGLRVEMRYGFIFVCLFHGNSC